MERKVGLCIRYSHEFRVGLSKEWETKSSVLPDRSPTSIFLICCMFKLRGWSNIDHNASCLPPKSLHNHCVQCLLCITVVPREIEDNGYTIWGGGGGEGAYVKMVIWTIAFNIRTPQSPLFTSVRSKFSKCKHIFSLRKRNPKTDFDRQEFL